MPKHNFEQSGPFIGMGGLAVALFLYAYSAIALPGWLHSLVMPLLWVLLFGLGVAWFSGRPVWVMVLPVVAVGAWFALMLGVR